MSRCIRARRRLRPKLYDLANSVCGAFVMLERDRRPQLISVADVVGVDGLPTPLPPSQGVFATVWASEGQMSD
jgi:hypothetical protein